MEHIEITFDPQCDPEIQYTAYHVERDLAGMGATAAAAVTDLAGWMVD